MGIWMIKGMAISLLMTLILELLFALCLGIRTRKEIRLVVLVNVLTNPVVVFTTYMNYICVFANTIVLTVVLELAAVVAEALLYQKHSRMVVHPWLFSFGINAFSYLSGELIIYLVS